MCLKIVNAGFPMELSVPDAEIEAVHRRVLERLEQAAPQSGGRAIVFVAGAPGSGKSILCAIWQALAERQGLSLRTVSLDGFHLPNAVLRERGLMVHHEGSP
jgi:pantothenate kinase